MIVTQEALRHLAFRLEEPALDRSPKTERPDGRVREQWVVAPNLYAIAQSPVTVFMGEISAADQAFFAAAMADWNSVLGNALQFVQVSTAQSARIRVRYSIFNGVDQCSANAIACANYPVVGSGQPGPNVWVKQSNWGAVSSEVKTYAAVHELGHNIGFVHTDWQVPTVESGVPATRTQVPGTLACVNLSSCDLQSVMRRVAQSYTGLSGADQASVLFLYPRTVAPVSVDYPAGGTRLTWNTIPGATGYFVERWTQHRYLNGSYVIETTDSWHGDVGATTTNTITDWSKPQTDQFLCGEPMVSEGAQEYGYFYRVRASFPNGSTTASTWFTVNCD